MEKKYIAALYKKRGLNTDPEFIEKQKQTLDIVFENITLPQAKILILIVFGVDVSKDSLSWLSNAADEVNPGLASSGVDGDVIILALALLRKILTEELPIAASVAIAIEAAEFGGKRICCDDPDFVSFSQDRILRLQIPQQNISPLATDEQTPLAEVLDEINQENFANSWASVRDAFDLLEEKQDSLGTIHQDKINELAISIRQIDEQIQTQWFAISKWSKGAKQPFSQLSVAEAMARGAFELASLMQSKTGPASAPALLNMALSESLREGVQQKYSFAEFCVGSPIVWRKSWTKFESTTDLSKLTPVISALGMAAQAADEADWQSRFRREIGIDPSFEISPLGFSLQLFHELLVLKFQD